MAFSVKASVSRSCGASGLLESVGESRLSRTGRKHSKARGGEAR